jgi:signal peptidase II
LKWLGLSLVVVILDQFTKFLASQYLQLQQPVEIFSWFNLTLVHNTGAAFSFLSHAGGWQRWFFIVLAITVSIIIMVWLLRLPAKQRWLACALALVLGGAIGNVWDRIVFGYVIDFIDVSISFLPWQLFNPWPAFNIADSAISVGAVMLIIDVFLFKDIKQQND